jgi:hypothetical protein
VGSNRVRTLMVLESLMLFNAVVCALVGAILLMFMAKPAGLVGAIIFWTTTAVLWQGKRHVDRMLPFDGASSRAARYR